jgi:hypothetical protein
MFGLCRSDTETVHEPLDELQVSRLREGLGNLQHHAADSSMLASERNNGAVFDNTQQREHPEADREGNPWGRAKQDYRNGRHRRENPARA